MKNSLRLLAALAFVILASCAPSRTPFSPGGPITVGMPEKLSDRERTFIPQIATELRNEGLAPVKHGKGDLQLDFTMSSGPINIETRIALLEDEAVLFAATGKSGGVPMIGRANVAQKSFDEAFAQLQSELSRVAGNRGWSSSSGTSADPASGSTYDELPVY